MADITLNVTRQEAEALQSAISEDIRTTEVGWHAALRAGFQLAAAQRGSRITILSRVRDEIGSKL
jgi:hypothetical protein